MDKRDNGFEVGSQSRFAFPNKDNGPDSKSVFRVQYHPGYFFKRNHHALVGYHVTAFFTAIIARTGNIDEKKIPLGKAQGPLQFKVLGGTRQDNRLCRSHNNTLTAT